LQDGATVDEKTALAPFVGPHGPLKTTDLYDTKKWGYTYPELIAEEKRTVDEKKNLSFLQQLLLKYHPDGHFDVRWQVVFPKIPKRKLGGPFTIHVFIDFPQVEKEEWNPSWLRKINYAGSIFLFARDKDEKCSQCEKSNAIRGLVDLTDCMFKLGLSVHDETAVMGANDGDIPPPTISDPSSGPLKDDSKSFLQIVVIKNNKKITLEDVGIDAKSIKVQCFQTVTDIEEKTDSEKKRKN